MKNSKPEIDVKLKSEIMDVANTLEERKLIFDKAQLTTHEKLHVRTKPRNYLILQMKLLELIGGENIVEIGSIRQFMNHDFNTIEPRCCNDGHSTYFWCQTKKNVYTVDTNLQCKYYLEDLHRRYPNLNYSIMDGISFLKGLNKKIDFLFLDAWDVSPGTDYAEKHLEAFLAAEQNLASMHFIGVDDTDIANGGKGRELIPHLINKGYSVLVTGRQTILINDKMRRFIEM